MGSKYNNRGYTTFEKTGDIYLLFYERAYRLLKANQGLMCLITSNKWMRARYGESLRKFFAEKTDPLQLLDFGGFKVFESATVDTKYPDSFANQHLLEKLEATSFKKDYTKGKSISEYHQKNRISIPVSSGPWIIGTRTEMGLKEKIERVGTPLKDWDISIFTME